MDFDEVWHLIVTFTKSYKYLWPFPVYFNSTFKTIFHIPKTSWYYRIWHIVVSAAMLQVLVASIIMLLLVNFVKPAPINATKIVICCLTTFLGYFGVFETVWMEMWMESSTRGRFIIEEN
jgi:hypothetical protein